MGSAFQSGNLAVLLKSSYCVPNLDLLTLLRTEIIGQRHENLYVHWSSFDDGKIWKPPKHPNCRSWISCSTTTMEDQSRFKKGWHS